MTESVQARSTATSHKPLETPHTLHSLHWSKATDQSQTFPPVSHTSAETEVGNHADNCLTLNCLYIYSYIYKYNLTFIAVVSFILLQSGINCTKQYNHF